MKTPVAFLIFNRSDTTQKVFEAIRQAKPPRLLVVADGPRPDRPYEVEKCAAARAVIDHVDWDCQVLTNFSDMNLGCRNRVSSGLDWVFDTVEEAIILEDDCLPHPTFFRFCEELLERYRNDERIMAISGDNFQFDRKRTDYSYYFSRYNHCWGWASWRRAWQHNDVEMNHWPDVRDSSLLLNLLSDSRTIDCWHKIFQDVYNGHVNTWCYQWTFACWLQNGLSILPSTNLVANIGFSGEATHTVGKNIFANMPVKAMSFPLQHPQCKVRNHQADAFTQEWMFGPSLLTRAKIKLKALLKRGRDD